MRCAIFFLVVFALAQTAPEVEITAELHHHLTFSNDQVRVFNVEVPPHSDTLMHWHRHDYVFVTLGASEVVNAIKDKDPVTIQLADGETRFTAGPFAHIARNLSAQPFRNVTIEILQDDKLRHSAAKWDEDRGLNILQGGTEEILWVRDGIRASLFELQPGAVVPEHRYVGPHLFVAVSDLDIRREVAGAAPTSDHFKSGEFKWLPAGYSHVITNTGHTPAKFVTLEWP